MGTIYMEKTFATTPPVNVVAIWGKASNQPIEFHYTNIGIIYMKKVLKKSD
jgi:hypothetical protein